MSVAANLASVRERIERAGGDLEVITIVAVTKGFGADVCRFLARATDGIYQIDGQGFFAADGTLLVTEEAVL